MVRLKKLTNKVFILLLEISLLLLGTGRKIILPNKNRKGNLLSSLFIFFIGIIEILNRFEIGLFQMAKLLRQKHVKKAIVIASAFLFLLSTFEWVPAKEARVSDRGIRTEVTNTVNTNVAAEYSKATITGPFFYGITTTPVNERCISFFYRSSSPTTVKRFLFIRSLRI